MFDNVSLEVRDDNSRFGITAWPGGRLPLPLVSLPVPDPVAHRPVRYERTPSGGIVVGAAEPGPEHGHAFGEVYLTLAELDLDDEEAILRFINVHGILGLRWVRSPTDVSVREKRGIKHIGGLRGMGTHKALRQELADARSAAASDVEHPFDIQETLAEFRLGAQLLRDLTAAWRLITGGEPPDRWECPLSRWIIDSSRTDHGQKVDTPLTERAATLLATYLTVLLAPFHPAVLEVVDGRRVHRSTRGLTLFWICGLELYNHIAEGAAYHTCANDRCARLYVRQHGRARHGQHRTTGTKYCSSHCAKATAQRRYRESQKAKR